MQSPIISVSGLRGVVGESLSPDIAVRYAAAFAAGLPAGPIVITRDGRATGAMLVDAIRASLLAMGRVALDAGVAATPTTGVLVRDQRCAGGVQVSASHNPAEYNGVKLFSDRGRVIPPDMGEAVRERYENSAWEWSAHDGIGAASVMQDATSAHLALVLEAVDQRRVRSAAFRVLLDANHGAGAALGRRVLEGLGCEVTVLGETPDGRFEHAPEPTAENLAGVAPRVAEMGAAVGFCQDPDADRLALVDENGRYVGEEYTLAVCADHVLRTRPGPVVTNCSSSRMTEEIAKRHGAPFFRSAVGEANVVDVMLEQRAVLGGEGAGGVIDPRIGLVRDSFIGMALVLEAMAARNLPLSVLVDELPRYAMHKAKINLDGARVPGALDALERRFDSAQSDRMDGLRLDWPDGKWLLVRPSNTEPIVRVICEAASEREAADTCAEAAGVIQNV